MKTIEQLREINESGMSYEKIAQNLNVSSKSVYRWLKGHSSPSVLALEKIQKFIKNNS